MKVLFIKNESSQIENNSSLFLFELLSQRNVEVIIISITSKSTIAFFRSIFRIRSMIKQHNFDLIHCFNNYAGKIVYFGFNRKKTVCTFFEKEINHIFKINIYGKINKWLTAFFTRHLFDKVILDSQKCLEHLSKKEKYHFLPKITDEREYFPIEKSFNKENLNLNIDETYIIYLANIESDFDNYQLISKAVSLLENKKIKLITFDYESSYIKNQRFNSADIIITALNKHTVKQITEEILLTNTKIISLENNLYLELYSKIDNLHFCDKSSNEIFEKMKVLLVSGNYNSRDKIIQINSDLIFKELIDIYKTE